jgi:7-cyano-7-deazaguanine synthase in queuosine biosynthesis
MGSASSIMALPTYRIQVIEPGSPAQRGWEQCVIGRDIEISPETLEAYCLSGWDPVIFDALMIAGAVEYCDRSKLRPSGGWGRQFQISVAVHDPKRWSKPAVVQALQRALQTVMGDRFNFIFVPRKKAIAKPVQTRLDFGDTANAVMPFSDGLDSRAVAGMLQASLGDNLIHVRLGSKQIDRPTRNGKPLPFTAVPYRVRGRAFPETSCRSRGFKFAMVGGLAAHLAKARRIIVPESGQGALGPVLVPVMHGQPDYRNHPVFAREMEAFLAALLGRGMRYEFPRLWFTKGQTVRSFVDGGGQNWEKTRSCWQKSRHMSVDSQLRQCGFCAACLLRRLSIHAAGLSEPPNTYMLEDLSAPTLDAGMAKGFAKLGPKQRRYADAAVLHLDYLADFQRSPLQAATLRRNVSQLSDALSMPATEVEVNLRKMLLEHEKEWKAFRDAAGAGSFISARSVLAA